jgi:hypothetical protein
VFCCCGAINCCFTASAISGLLATSTRWRVPPDFMSDSIAGIRMVEAMNTGISRVMMMNALLRMRSRYSRRMISQVLCILAHHVDEDFFERRLDQFKAADAGMLRA